MKLHNIHVHSTYSDGELEPEELIELAEREHLELLGISDHGFTSKLSSALNTKEAIQGYIADLSRLKEYGNGVELKLGLEIDFSIQTGYEPSKLPFDILNKLDYVLFEYVHKYTEIHGWKDRRSIEELLKIRHKLKIPVGLAHNDLQLNFDDEEIAELLSANDIFVEICQSEPLYNVGRNTRDGLDYYELFSPELLEEMEFYRVGVAVGTDVHSGISLSAFGDAYEFIKKHNLSFSKLVQ